MALYSQSKTDAVEKDTEAKEESNDEGTSDLDSKIAQSDDDGDRHFCYDDHRREYYDHLGEAAPSVSSIVRHTTKDDTELKKASDDEAAEVLGM